VTPADVVLAAVQVWVPRALRHPAGRSRRRIVRLLVGYVAITRAAWGSI
jgi:hypothetical protein